uniref:Uncharacterized protein n=1 Tax=Amphimedon queenslandica TaxID=400682 RepID=A0A1X7TWY8_AMPQE
MASKMANVVRELHLSVSSPSVEAIRKEEVLDILQDSGVTEKDITVTHETRFVIKVSETVASTIISNRDKHPSTWVLAAPDPVVSVTISYCENIFQGSNDAPAKSAPAITNDTIVKFLTELNDSTSISYGLVVTFKRIDACYFRQFRSPQEIRDNPQTNETIFPLLQVEVVGSNEASFSDQNCSKFRDLLFDHFIGH